MALVAEIIGVGTELLLGNVANTDAQMISQGLSALGIHVYFHTVVGDNDARLRQAVEIASLRSDILITTGGLGPTYDDMTKQTLADCFGLPLERHQPTVDSIRAYFSRLGAAMSPNNERQADLPRGCIVMQNDCGTAPGCIFEANGKHIIMLPGPPHECAAMFNGCAVPYLKTLAGGCLVSHNIHIFGIGEASVEEKLRPMMLQAQNPTIAPYAKEGEVWLRVTASADTEAQAEALTRPVIDDISSQLGDAVYGIDAGSLESTLLQQLKRQGLTLAAAESCTGGLLGARLTALPGASEVFCGSVCAYTPLAKTALLDVHASLLERHGVVSAEVAEAMARGAKNRLAADLGVGITGYAGPTAENGVPVGTVYIALCDHHGQTTVKQLMLGSDRNRVRVMAVNHALNMARLSLLA